MDAQKLAELYKNIAQLSSQNESLGKEIEKFALGVTESEYTPLIEAYGKARSICRVDAYDIKKAQWKARTVGREFNAKVFAEKNLGREVTVDSRFKDDSLAGTGIVSGYIRRPDDGTGREYAYVIVEIQQSSHKIGAAGTGTFSAGDMEYTFLRPVAGYYYWHAEELVLNNSAPIALATGDCECGATKTGSPIHSNWCPQYK